MKRHSIIILTVLILGIFTTVFGQNNQHTENKADQALRGSGRVNASSLGLEIDVPLGSYPGRGINVPIGLSYSSKLWRLEFNNLQPKPNLPDQCITVSRAKFAENSASGWTTSMEVPYIEYTGEDNLFDEKGFPVTDVICPAGQGGGASWYVKRLTVHLPSGETHELRANDTPVVLNSTPVFDWNTTFYAVDGSNIKYVENSSTNTYRLLLPDGSFYDFANTRASLNLATIRKASKFSDRNGNYTTYYAPGSTDDQGVTHPNGYWKDTLGRNIPVPFKPEAPTAPTVQNYQMPGMTGIYKFHWKKLKDTTAAESGLANFSDQLQLTSVLFPSDSDNSVIDTSGTAFNPIVLTAGGMAAGQFCRVKGNIFGEIVTVQYPTGGEERFEYAVVPPLGDTGNSNAYTSVHWKINRGIGNRKVYITAGSSEYLEWLYSATKNGNYGYKISITAPDSTISERFLHRGYDNCTGCTPALGTWGYDNGLSGMPYEEVSYNSVGQVVSRKLTHWEKTTFPNAGYRTKDWHPRVTQEESIVYDTAGNGVSATTRYEFEGNLNLIDTPVLVNKTTQYAFVAVGGGSSAAPGGTPDPNPTPVPTPIPPSPIRITETTYLINDTVNYPNQADRDAYKNQNMVGLVTVSKVKNGAGTVVVAQSETKYDETAYPLISAGTHAKWQNPNNNYRANPTTSRVWDSTKGAVTNSSAYLATHAQFDNFGNQRKVWDAKGIMTETDYSSTYGYAFPTLVTTAIPDPNPTQNPDGLAHGSQTAFQSSATFNATTGLPLTATDANGLETRIEYDAATLRPRFSRTFYNNVQVGGTAETVYHDETNNYWVKNRVQIDATNWAESITYFDGLGRAYKAEEINSQGNIFVEKEFDQDGRVKRVTNPFRTGEAKYWTTNVYDEASRVKEVILPDGAKVITDYGISTATGFVGITKQITDQAGKKRKGISDASGNMIRVIEDPTGQNLNTDYIFDTLGNLRKTIQGEQSRYFSYDSLGRLLYAKQPEQDTNAAFSYTDSITNNSQWSVKYEYDDNGNITKTTDAKGVYVQGTYDKFNRLIFRNYSDATPDVSFFYDGKYLNIYDQMQTATGSVKGKTTGIKSSVSRTNYTAFNNLGQLETHQQITDGQTYQTSYQYDSFGRMISETYPSMRTVKVDYNADGDVSSIWGTVGSQNRLYANGFHYNSSGAMERMKLGNGKWETYAYNERQQITEIALGNSATDKSLLRLEYGYGNNTQNNGNLLSQKVSFNGLTNPFEQTYAYDSLNRLQVAEEKVNNSTTWKQTFDYDRFGNRNFNTANNNTTTLGSCTQIVCNPVINTSDNQIKKDQNNDNIKEYDYDENGNLTRDAQSKKFTYDAENHQIKVDTVDANGNVISNNGEYLYDGDGRRVKKISSTEITVFVYDGGGQLVAEYSTALAQTPQVSYLTADHLGSARVITNQNGAVTTRKDYMAFGDEASSAQRTANPNYDSSETRKGYTGYEKDGESGLEFAQARYYNSQHGRFTSVDPLTASATIKNPQTFNRYSYVLNSPYKFTDPLGLLSVTTNACGQWCRNSYQGEGRSGGAASGGNYESEEENSSDDTAGDMPSGQRSLPCPATHCQDPRTAQAAKPITIIFYIGEFIETTDFNPNDDVDVNTTTLTTKVPIKARVMQGDEILTDYEYLTYGTQKSPSTTQTPINGEMDLGYLEIEDTIFGNDQLKHKKSQWLDQFEGGVVINQPNFDSMIVNFEGSSSVDNYGKINATVVQKGKIKVESYLLDQSNVSAPANPSKIPKKTNSTGKPGK